MTEQVAEIAIKFVDQFSAPVRAVHTTLRSFMDDVRRSSSDFNSWQKAAEKNFRFTRGLCELCAKTHFVQVLDHNKKLRAAYFVLYLIYIIFGDGDYGCPEGSQLV